MSLDLTGRQRSSSQASSGRSTPVPRASRRAVEDGILKADKGLRKYGVAIERALASWEISPEEWADYIAFLGRLLKAIQLRPNDALLLPHSGEVASKLAQCLNPALPSGVHQKALEVYHYIFSAFGQGYLAGHIHEFLPGLAAVLSFASLSVRPGLYAIYEDFITHLPATDLRPLLKSLILSLIPALEEETSEDFDRAFRILDSVERTFSPTSDSGKHDSDKDGYFWQCLFLAVITSPSRRQGALNFLIQRLPKFTPIGDTPQSSNRSSSKKSESRLSAAAEAILSPEPGLLIRCFASGLSDNQVLIQRGFLDLLVTHIPLNSPVLQTKVREDDVDRLITAATHVLLRREMSLNRRLWSWFLGSSTSAEANGSTSPTGTEQNKESSDAKSDRALQYFATYGKAHLERCILAMFAVHSSNPAATARPFRICLSLMDRWEIGGAVIPQIFLPAMQNAYRYSRKASESDTAEVVRSASLFFDGIESMLIWANLLRLLRDGAALNTPNDSLATFAWIIRCFNVSDEEMLTTHIPHAAAYLLTLLADSDTSTALDATGLDIVVTLIEMIPERALTSSKNNSKASSNFDGGTQSRELRRRIEELYGTQERSVYKDLVITPRAMGAALCGLANTLALTTLREETDRCFGQCIATLLVLATKIPESTVTSIGGLLKRVYETLESKLSQGGILEFPIINSIISLIVGMPSGLLSSEKYHRTSLEALESILYEQLWQYLSVRRPKYNVEAVKAIWQLHEHSFSRDLAEASLTAHARLGDGDSMPKEIRAETVRRFIILWNHTVPPGPSSKHGMPSIIRRASTMSAMSDVRQTAERLKILTMPLMLVLDTLGDATDSAHELVNTWMRTVPSLEQILRIHFDWLRKSMYSPSDENEDDTGIAARLSKDKNRDLEYILDHFLNILRCGDAWTWQCLGNMSRTEADDDVGKPCLSVLAEHCCSLVVTATHISPGLERKCIDILQMILSGPYATSIKPMDLDSRLLVHLFESLSEGSHRLYGPLLRVVTLALGLRLADAELDDTASARSRGSINLKRPLQTVAQSSPDSSTAHLVSTPPPQLLNCLKLAFSSPSARLYLDQWLLFLSNVLPAFADYMFSNLITIVECICKQLDEVHLELTSLSQTTGDAPSIAPDTTAMALLDALEMILARAHESLAVESAIETEPKVAPQPRGLIGNMTAGVFKSESLPNRTSQSNSRLTVILALQDAIRVSVKLWAWSSRYTETNGFDKTSSASTSYNALKVRNRTRHVLEEVFSVEPLETLEAVVFIWCYSTAPGQATATLDLLHVIHGLRPKTIVPATLDALCSRTNSAILPWARQSSQTTDLTAIDIIFFLRAYLRSIEDDAMDEVWADCMAFFRDVLSNPLPYRQVLPGLLSIILLLAQKVDNTNFGEQRKMRRDLGDVFLRLLTATFTTLPAGYIHETSPSDGEATAGSASNSDLGQSSMSLIAVLKEVTASIEVILETSDRTMNAVNNITSSLIAPLLHAKSFPENMTADSLTLLLQVAKKTPSAKTWKKELADAFNDPKLLLSPPEVMEKDWFPVLHQWSVHDKERMPELISRLVAPSSAGIMFGVGASAARLEADRKAQLNLRRMCILLLSAPTDTFVAHLRDMWTKLVELFDASLSSSPSAAVKAELFMLCRALVLCTSSIHLSPLWPVIDDTLQSALSSLAPGAPNSGTFGNLALLQACKLLDLLVALSPDEFQLHEWLYISDTIDAVYQPSGWAPSALSDQVAEHLTLDGVEDSTGITAPTPVATSGSGRKRPLIDSEASMDSGDYKAMTRDDFARVVLRPFLSQLSIHAYEGVYSMDAPDVDVWRRILLKDVLDLTTIVE